MSRKKWNFSNILIKKDFPCEMGVDEMLRNLFTGRA